MDTSTMHQESRQVRRARARSWQAKYAPTFAVRRVYNTSIRNGGPGGYELRNVQVAPGPKRPGTSERTRAAKEPTPSIAPEAAAEFAAALDAKREALGLPRDAILGNKVQSAVYRELCRKWRAARPKRRR